MIREAVPKRSPAEWAFRWLWDQPEVSVVLSGMNTMDMLKENIRIASEVRTGEFSPEDNALLQKVRRAINAKIKVPCTGCGYCQPCPFGVDIPGIFRCYNVHYTDGWFTGLREYIMCTTFRAEPTNASLCKKCGKCESHCPQNIHIRDELAKAARTMEGPAYKAVSVAARRMFRK
jgi:predicted aldo/keto reductase-like oxidoreductase